MANLLNTITTAAGNGAGDGGPATKAQMGPADIVIGADGSVYIADTANHRIRRVSADGTVTTVAGNGTWGYSGDGGPATAAQLNAPKDVAIGMDNSLYIADKGNHRIRRINSDGTITTVAGNGSLGYSGDGGQATAAQLNYPESVAIGADGSLYIADRGNHRIRQVNGSGTITTVTGNGTWGYSGDGGLATAAQLCYPTGVEAGADGSLYIADTSNHCMRRVGSDGIITTVAGNGAIGYGGDGGPAIAAQLDYPAAAVVGTDGSLYIADADNHRVRRVGLDGKIVTVAGNGIGGYSGDGGPAVQAQLHAPAGVALGVDGSLYIADHERIRRIGLDGIITSIAGNGSCLFSGDGGRAAAAGFNQPADIAAGTDGSLYIVDAGNNRIRRVGPDRVITTVAGNGDYWFSGDGGQAVATSFDQAAAVAAGADGSIYIAEKGSHRIRRVGTDGVITTVAGNGMWGYSGDGGPAVQAQLYAPAAVAVGTDGSLYIADAGNHCIRWVGPDGFISTLAGNGVWGYSGDGGPATQAQLYTPADIALGGDGSVYVADTGNNRIRRVGPDGIIITVAGNGTPGYSGDWGPALQAQIIPANIALDADSRLYIADSNNHRIRRVGSDGIITTVVGNGAPGYSGDGEAATAAGLNAPAGITLGTEGSLYIADRGNNFIRKIPSDYLSAVWVPNRSSASVSKIVDRTVIATVDVQNSPVAICVDRDNVVWAANSGSNNVSKIVNGLPAAVIGVGNNPRGICVDRDNAIWVTNYGSNNLSKIVNGAVTATINIDHPQGICVDKDNALWVVSPDNRCAQKIVNGVVTATVSIGGVQSCPAAICVDLDNAVWVANYSENNIAKIVNGTMVSSINVGTYPQAICVDKDNAIWAANYGSNSVSKIVNGTVAATIYIGGYITGICVDISNAIWVSFGWNVVSKIVNNSIVATITVGTSPYLYGDATGLQAAMLFGWV